MLACPAYAAYVHMLHALLVLQARIGWDVMTLFAMHGQRFMEAYVGSEPLSVSMLEDVAAAASATAASTLTVIKGREVDFLPPPGIGSFLCNFCMT